jgi:pimeloyl-ACP methyl ester carboxylesterase
MKKFFLLLGLILSVTACSQQGATQLEPIVVTPSASAPSLDLSSFYSQVVNWSPCEDLAGALCTEIKVPLDYSDPKGLTIDLHLAKLPAQKQKTASLLFNPGGPGAPGITYLEYAADVFSKTLLENFDIVAFDPRGVGLSNPIDCLTDKELDEFLAFDGTPDSSEEIEEFLRLTKKMADGCAKNENNLVAHIGTKDAARDMDVIRAILNEKQLNFLGVSYGTFLGATYAELFPQNVGQFVLDGGIDPQLDSMTLSLDQAVGLENALNRFLDDCFTKRDCPFEKDKDAAITQILNLLSKIDETPLKTDDPSRDLTEAMAIYGIAAFLYSDEYWPFLRDAFNSAFAGDGSVFLFINDLFNERNSDGSFATNTSEAIYAINCFDKPATETVEDVQRIAEEWKQKAPVFGAYLAWSNLACGYWPAGDNEGFNLRAAGSNPILVIGTLNDPATPYFWSEALVEQLENAMLLTFDADGHTAYMRGSSCVDQTVDDFLLKREIPQGSITCK